MNPDPKHNPERNPAVLVEVTRGPIVESVHYGAVVVADVDGNLVAWAGNPGLVTYYRSASKPLQAIALVESGGADHFGLTDAEVKTYYETHKDRFRKPETVTLSEIFLSTIGKPDADVLARAQKLVAQLRAGTDFRATAVAQSEREDENRVRIAEKSGGQVGTFNVPDITNKPVADAIKDLKVGGISEPIKSDAGYIILHVDARTPAGEPVFDENKVREALAYDRLPKEREAYVRKLRQEGYVELAPAYRDAVGPLLKTEAGRATTAAAPAKKDDKKKKP